MGVADSLTCLLRNLYAGQEATEQDMEQRTGFKLGKEYIKAVYCHLIYLTYVHSTSCKMPGWMKHKLESRLPGEISITSDMQMTPLNSQQVWNTKQWTQDWKRSIFIPVPKKGSAKGMLKLLENCAHFTY